MKHWKKNVKQRLATALSAGFLVGLVMWSTTLLVQADEPTDSTKLLAKGNLVAWCIVPFDAAQRGQAERHHA